MKRDDLASVFLPDNDVFTHLDWIKTCPLLALLKRSHVVIIEKMKETCGHRIKMDGKAHQPSPVKMSRPFTACLKLYLSNRSCKFILEQLQLKLEACLNGLGHLTVCQHTPAPMLATPGYRWLPLVIAGLALVTLVVPLLPRWLWCLSVWMCEWMLGDCLHPPREPELAVYSDSMQTHTHTPTCQCACTFSYADLCWWAPQCQVQGRSRSLPCRQPPGHIEFKGFSADLALFHSPHSPHSPHSLSLHDLKVQKIHTHMCIYFSSILTRRSYCHLSQVFICAHDGDSQQLLRDLLSY